MICPNCSNETSNPKFCCRRCAIVFYNRTVPKRKLKKKCKNCSALILAVRTYCSDCQKVGPNGYSKYKTLGDVVLKYRQYGAANRFSLIRGRARNLLRRLGKTACFVCSYAIHVEAAHVKPISEFPMEALLSEINSPENIIALCPNHRWEFDNGRLKLQV